MKCTRKKKHNFSISHELPINRTKSHNNRQHFMTFKDFQDRWKPAFGLVQLYICYQGPQYDL